MILLISSPKVGSKPCQTILKGNLSNALANPTLLNNILLTKAKRALFMSVIKQEFSPTSSKCLKRGPEAKNSQAGRESPTVMLKFFLFSYFLRKWQRREGNEETTIYSLQNYLLFTEEREFQGKVSSGILLRCCLCGG